MLQKILKEPASLLNKDQNAEVRPRYIRIKMTQQAIIVAMQLET